MRTLWILALSPLLVFLADVRHAAAQECRFVQSEADITICVCRQGQNWRINPYRVCETAASAAPEPVVRPQPRTLSPEELRQRQETREIQEVLNAIECDAGVPDGISGRQTRSAIQCFHQAIDRPDTTELTAEERQILLETHDQLPEAASVLRASLRQELPPTLVATAPPEPQPQPQPESQTEPEPEPAPTPQPVVSQPNPDPEPAADTEPAAEEDDDAANILVRILRLIFGFGSERDQDSELGQQLEDTSFRERFDLGRSLLRGETSLETLVPMLETPAEDEEKDDLTDLAA